MYVCERGACRPGRGRGLVWLDTWPTGSKKWSPMFPANEEMWDVRRQWQQSRVSPVLQLGRGQRGPRLPQSHIAAMPATKNTHSDAPSRRAAPAAALWTQERCSQRQPVPLPRSQRLMRPLLQTDFLISTKLKLSSATGQPLSHCSSSSRVHRCPPLYLRL